MDLFGDLPEPERSPRPAAGKEAQKGSLLFDGLPPASSADSGTVFRLSQDQGDLCFSMISHQPAVAMQVLSTRRRPRRERTKGKEQRERPLKKRRMAAKSLWKRKFVKVFRQFENKCIRLRILKDPRAKARPAFRLRFFLSVPAPRERAGSGLAHGSPRLLPPPSLCSRHPLPQLVQTGSLHLVFKGQNAGGWGVLAFCGERSADQPPSFSLAARPCARPVEEPLGYSVTGAGRQRPQGKDRRSVQSASPQVPVRGKEREPRLAQGKGGAGSSSRRLVWRLEWPEAPGRGERSPAQQPRSASRACLPAAAPLLRRGPGHSSGLWVAGAAPSVSAPGGAPSSSFPPDVAAAGT
ncbi:integrin-linked kinase-associated serine/threonine phosphatase 2C isoform X4 [Phacochoerus africanus]|uniref:integrin-linked kinase-associated serine/threonine phosphatase 2C isoform X4 n=1 Tax=Phacochoerus africanus TaxID=41426 RepID=UPI001FD8DF0F|nr:integrin-linked kinase-associated serine/threonine phosphatase 2C isoform X4 [Phacochoerus africanus]